MISAQVPARSAIPTFLSATSTTITLGLQPTSDNGGSAVTAYNVYATAATSDSASSETYTKVASYDGLSMQFVLDNSAETSFATGQIYRFRFSATNIIGEGQVSNSVTIALAADAGTPTAPVRNLALSTKTSVYITWAAVVPVDGFPIDGYMLNVTKLGTGISTCVYNGSANSERLFYNVTGLETAQRYAFSVTSVNFNGVSLPSPELHLIVCVPPTGFVKPVYNTSTASSVTLDWAPPSDDGGCPLQTYELYINDGLGGSTFLEIDRTHLLNRPYIGQHTATNQAGADGSTPGAALVTGNAYRFKLKAISEVGSDESTNYLEVVVASVPLAPTSPPS